MDPQIITCPYCWQEIQIEAPEGSGATIEFVTDCEVCCRPIRVLARQSALGSEREIEARPEAD